MKCGGTSVRAALAEGATSVFTLSGKAAVQAAGGFLAQDENWRFRAELLTYLLEVGEHDAILGHFRYDGAHERYLDAADFVTVLRPPAERFRSLYDYRQARSAPTVKADRPLDEILDDPTWQAAGRVYADTFCGDPSLVPGSAEAVDAAVANLRRLAVVGRLDDMSSFGAAVARVTGRPVTIPTRNAGKAQTDMVAEQQAAIEELCRPDQAVYDALFG